MAKRCEHQAYEPAKKVCAYLMQHGSTEFTEINVKDAIGGVAFRLVADGYGADGRSSQAEVVLRHDLLLAQKWETLGSPIYDYAQADRRGDKRLMANLPTLKSLVHTLADTFISRNNDVSGYWAMGMLYREALEGRSADWPDAGARRRGHNLRLPTPVLQSRVSGAGGRRSGSAEPDDECWRSAFR